jgi:hypothetical protein
MRKLKTLQRKDLMIDPEEATTLQRLLRAASLSEAVRIAVRDRIFIEKVLRAHRAIQEAGGIEDVYSRADWNRKR